MNAHDDFDDLLLDAVGEMASELLAVPDDELPGQLRTLVQDTLTLRRPDGTWPPAELLLEILRTYLDVLDERGLPGGPAPTWIDAWREAADHPDTFRRMLDELRDFDDTSGIPRYPPPEELRLIIDP
ncbi:MAG TPA: hypothetical protein VGO78_04750 [Acidimicrobiales bacterium]|nr:hypothetical protein [Acidimicrobiales bacterium]